MAIERQTRSSLGRFRTRSLAHLVTDSFIIHTILFAKKKNTKLRSLWRKLGRAKSLDFYCQVWIFIIEISGTAGNNGVRIYDVRQRSAAAILSLKSRSTVNCLSWSPNGHLLAAGCQSGVTYLWDVRQPTKEMALLKTQEKNPVQVISIHFSFQSQFLPKSVRFVSS